MNKQPLLSICIPTWNRSKLLSISLKSFSEQLSSIDVAEIEIFVSDNCSDDDTPQVVQSFIEQGLPITYNRNPENIGAAKNFIKCMQWASGKYIWLLGDDDILKKGALAYLLPILKNNDFGTVHIRGGEKKKKVPEKQIFDNVETFFCTMSFMVTFMSGCIFLKDAVPLVKDLEKYIPTHLLQVPVYITSSLSRRQNIIVWKSLLESGLDSSNNGGYNFYQVFVESYLDIWNEFVLGKKITSKCFENIKKDIYVRFVIWYNWSLLIRRKNIAPENKLYKGNRKGFKIKGACKILLKNYGFKWYFWVMILKYPYCFMKDLKKYVIKNT